MTSRKAQVTYTEGKGRLGRRREATHLTIRGGGLPNAHTIPLPESLRWTKRQAAPHIQKARPRGES